MNKRNEPLGRLIWCMTAAVSAWWAGCWMAWRPKTLPPGLPPLYYDPFVRRLAHHGCYVLGCGGGIISEPDRAIQVLQRRYGQEGLRDRCYALVFEQAPEAGCPDGVDGTALGILYRLGDQPMLHKLLEMRGRQLGPATGLVSRNPPPDRCESLIAGLCQRLRQPLPVGLAPLTDQEIFSLFN